MQVDASFNFVGCGGNFANRSELHSGIRLRMGLEIIGRLARFAVNKLDPKHCRDLVLSRIDSHPS